MLSESVSKALMKYGGDEAEESALFAHTFDNFFDCLNISNHTNTKQSKVFHWAVGILKNFSLVFTKHQRKVFQNPYRSEKDFRLKV